MTLQEQLFSLRDVGYQQFLSKLIPNVDPAWIIGVRTPALRKLGKQIQDKEAFLRSLPHTYFEENQLHALSLNEEKDFAKLISEIEAFLTFVDNWATCDQLRPKIFANHQNELLPHIRRWLDSSHAYTIRFGIEMLMCHYLDDHFDPEYPKLVASTVHEDYYVRMMVAWYFATALAKQYDAVLPYITGCHLEKWTHNKAISKAVDSFRITQDQKRFLKQYRLP